VGCQVKTLNYELKKICRRNKDGSFTTQANRERMLSQIADQLHMLGFHNMKVTSLKQKHVWALVRHWQEKGISAATIKNRMSALRWWSEKIGKKEVVFKRNDDYKIDRRETVARKSKALVVDDEVINSISDPFVRASVSLQVVFPLRREEAMKICPVKADRGDFLHLDRSWCKGGRERDIPIITSEERKVLDEAKAIAGNGSLIPAHLNYKQQMKLFEKLTHKAGIGHTHGFRHANAQKRFEKEAGFKSPVNGGPKRNEMSDVEKAADDKARLQVSKELGHSRKEVAGAYLGGLISENASEEEDD